MGSRTRPMLKVGDPYYILFTSLVIQSTCQCLHMKYMDSPSVNANRHGNHNNKSNIGNNLSR